MGSASSSKPSGQPQLSYGKPQHSNGQRQPSNGQPQLSNGQRQFTCGMHGRRLKKLLSVTVTGPTIPDNK